MKEAVLRNRVINIIADDGGVKLEKVIDSARLEADLGITGDDMWDILEHLEKEFGVDLGDTDFSYFFYPEGANILWHLFNREKVASIKRYPITVAHLVDVARSGKWFNPSIYHR